jgi:hypothetical protein
MKCAQPIIIFLFWAGILGANPGKSNLPWPEQAGKSLFVHQKIEKTQDKNKLEKQIVFIIQNELNGAKSGLKLYSFKVSPMGQHLAFVQLFHGIPIYGTDVKVNIDKGETVSSIFFKLVDTQSWETTTTKVAVVSAIKKVTGPADQYIIENSIYPSDNIPVYGWKVEYGNSDGSLHREAFISVQYSKIYSTDLHLYYNGIGGDTMASGSVFNPDPLTSSGSAYGFPFIDDNDLDNAALNRQRLFKSFPVSFLKDSFFLIGPYARIVEISNPVTPITYSLNGVFDFPRSQPGFEDVNVMYHIHNFHEHVNNLGFSTLGDTSLRVDAHALNNADQSEFDYFNKDIKLLFGQGGIDDAEDADVIIHEYSHSLSYSASPNNVAGSERGALEEALCDYFACSYSANISAFNSSHLFNWDGNETWNGRSCFTNKFYPTDLTNNRYNDAEIWTGSLMQIWETCGRTATDRNMLGSLYYLGKYITLSDAAKIFLHVDSTLNEGKNSWNIINVFVNRGLLPISYKTDITPFQNIPGFKLVDHFAKEGLVYLDFAVPQSGEVSLFDIQGRKLFSENISGRVKVNIFSPGLKDGIYMLNIRSNYVNTTIKLRK